MTRDYFTRLYDYTFWADEKVWSSIMQLTDEQYTQALAYSHGTIRDQWIHTIATMHIYFTLIQGQPVLLNDKDLPDRASLRQQWGATRAIAESVLAGLTPDELNRMLEWPGRPTIYVWEALTQVVMHSMDHRAQVLAGLHQLGAPTFGQDFIYHAIESRQ